MLLCKFVPRVASVCLLLQLMPVVAFGSENGIPDVKIQELVNPNKLFDLLKKNISIPISGDYNFEVPTPTKILASSSPRLREINREVKKEAGIDLSKLIGWFAKALQVFFQFIVNLLNQVSEALKS